MPLKRHFQIPALFKEFKNLHEPASVIMAVLVISQGKDISITIMLFVPALLSKLGIRIKNVHLDSPLALKELCTKTASFRIPILTKVLRDDVNVTEKLS